MALKEDYLDDILDTSVNEKRKYRMINNADGTISLEDVTEYSQNGDNFGASDINITNKTVNELVAMGLNVRCNSETGYLEVFINGAWEQSELQALITSEIIDLKLESRTLGEPSSTANDSAAKRTFNTGNYIKGLATNNLYNASKVTSVSFTNKSITTVNDSGFGIGIPCDLIANIEYNITSSMTASKGRINTVYYAEDGTYIGSETSEVGNTTTSIDFTFTVPSNTKYTVLLFTNSAPNTQTVWNDIVLTRL